MIRCIYMQKIVKVDPCIKVKNVADLLDLPQVVRVTDFDEKGATTFASDFEKASLTGQSVIPVIVDSYGGYVHSLLSMISVIRHSPIPVATICIGKAMSCGSILLTCGGEGLRFMDPLATVMIHDVSSLQFGKTAELKASAAETERLSDLIFGIMAKNCGQKEEYFTKLLHDKSHAEWYLTANEAKKHNIINHIRVPNFRVNVSVDVSFDDVLPRGKNGKGSDK